MIRYCKNDHESNCNLCIECASDTACLFLFLLHAFGNRCLPYGVLEALDNFQPSLWFLKGGFLCHV